MCNTSPLVPRQDLSLAQLLHAGSGKASIEDASLQPNELCPGLGGVWVLLFGLRAVCARSARIPTGGAVGSFWTSPRKWSCGQHLLSRVACAPQVSNRLVLCLGLRLQGTQPYEVASCKRSGDRPRSKKAAEEEEEEERICGGCYGRFYCCKACQRNDWQRHRDEWISL